MRVTVALWNVMTADREKPFHQAQVLDLQRMLAQLRAATEASRTALWHNCPETGETWYSDVWFSLLGYQPGAFQPSFNTFLTMMHPDDRDHTLAAFQDLVEDRVALYAADFRLRAADGTWRWIGATGAKVSRDEEGLPYLVCGMQRDISDRKQTEAKLAEAARTSEDRRQLLNNLAENAPAALFEFRMDASGLVTMPYVTSGVADILGVSQQDIAEDGNAAFRNIDPADQEQIGVAIAQSRETLAPFRVRYRVHHPDRGMVWVQAHSKPQRFEDGSTAWFGSISDTTPEVRREEELARARDHAMEMQRKMQDLALLDGLTGLPNRRYFDSRLEERRTNATDTPKGIPAAVLVRLDLDRFKNVNDTLGHAAGDAVLVHVASVLKASTRPQDFAARVGGDEFSILLAQGTQVDEARAIVHRIQERLDTPFTFEGKVCRFGASFGIASSDQGSIRSGDLLSFADAALYEAKARGRNRMEVFSNDLHVAILESRRLAVEIEAALENGEFEPFFQPQVCAQSGRLVGLEVLARWVSPERGIIPPNRFMPVAEQIRVVPLIDKHMLEVTCDLLSGWNAQGFFPPKISFNVSADRLRDWDMTRTALTLQDKGVTVAFELLESILLEEEDAVFRHRLDQVREAGIEIEIDDFGSGHASILGLQQARPNTLKIDKRLTQDITEADQSRELIQSIVGIAHALRIKTTVEGVETEEQAQLLRHLGCDVLQGYLFARPLSAQDILRWVADNGHDSRPNDVDARAGGA